jgi:hypothetical protein
VSNNDSIGDQGINEHVYKFVNPILAEKTEENGDSIGDQGIDKHVYRFVNPLILSEQQ